MRRPPSAACAGLRARRSAAFRARSHRARCPICPTLATESLPTALWAHPRSEPADALARCSISWGARSSPTSSMVDDTSQRAGTWCFMADSPATTAKTALCARSRAELVVSRGRLSLVVYLTGTLSSYKRALPAVLNVSSNPQYWGTASYHRHAGAVSGHTTADYDLPSALRQCALS